MPYAIKVCHVSEYMLATILERYKQLIREKYWFGTYQPGAWRFLPCDFWGKPKPLEMLKRSTSEDDLGKMR